jgi:hypothetical protein
MIYRAPLLSATGGIDSEVFGLLTDAQVARLAVWSINESKPVLELLQSARFMAEQVGDSNRLNLLGTLPHCGLYGCLDPYGHCHT